MTTTPARPSYSSAGAVRRDRPVRAERTVPAELAAAMADLVKTHGRDACFNALIAVPAEVFITPYEIDGDD